METEFTPIPDSEITQQIGNRIYIGYLADDSDCGFNPMKEFDGQGNFHLRNERNSIWSDEGEVLCALRCYNYGRPEVDREFLIDGKRTTLLELAAEQAWEAMGWPELQDMLERMELELEEGETLDDFKLNHKDDICAALEDDVQDEAEELFPKYWTQIVSPYVVPISFSDKRGRVDISVTTWNGDFDHLPNGVWVACKVARDNIGSEGIPDEIRARAEKYAESVCSEMSAWASGEVYGVCMEVYECDEDGEQGELLAEEACWSYIGTEYAEQTLKEDFATNVEWWEEKFVKEEAEAAAQALVQQARKTYPVTHVGI